MEPSFYTTYYQHETTHWWFRWRFELIANAIRRRHIGGSARILDAGCGTGQMLQHLKDDGQIFGIDASAEAVKFASLRGSDRIVLASVNRMPFLPESFDCALALDVIEHVDNDAEMLSNLASVLKQGGCLIVTAPAFQLLWSDHDVINRHRRRYTVPQLRQLLEGCGLTIETLTYCNAVLFVPILIVRKLKSLKKRSAQRTGRAAGALESDLSEIPRLVNEALLVLLRLEMKIVDRLPLPFGVSIFAVATKPLTVGKEAS